MISELGTKLGKKTKSMKACFDSPRLPGRHMSGRLFRTTLPPSRLTLFLDSTKKLSNLDCLLKTFFPLSLDPECLIWPRTRSKLEKKNRKNFLCTLEAWINCFLLFLLSVYNMSRESRVEFNWCLWTLPSACCSFYESNDNIYSNWNEFWIKHQLEYRSANQNSNCGIFNKSLQWGKHAKVEAESHGNWTPVCCSRRGIWEKLIVEKRTWAN